MPGALAHTARRGAGRMFMLAEKAEVVSSLEAQVAQVAELVKEKKVLEEQVGSADKEKKKLKKDFDNAEKLRQQNDLKTKEPLRVR